MKSERVAEIVRWFGLDQSKPQEQIEIEIPQAVGGRIILLNGPSGAGKSRLLGRIKDEWVGPRRAKPMRCRWVDLSEIELPSCAVVDCFPKCSLEQTLLSLNRVGLAEAWDYVRTPAGLSEGQKFRLRLAMGLGRAGKAKSEIRNSKSETSSKTQIPNKTENPRNKFRGLSVLACDEFCAILDRVTAKVVARTLRRTIDQSPNVCAIVATSHDDLVEALRPDVLIRCDFGAAEIFDSSKF